MKTVLYADEKHNFNDFYVCNDIVCRSTDRIDIGSETIRRNPIRRIKNATSLAIRNFCGNFTILTGTGGLGKSMMMIHILLDCVENYQTYKQIPVLVTLKDYDASAYLSDFIFSKVRDLCLISRDQFDKTLINGGFIILLDGLDEVPSNVIDRFEHQVESFTDRYSSNMFIISSRPNSDFVSLGRFAVTRLVPFDLEQAVKLIENLDFRLDDPSFKERFIKELSTKLFYTHTDFTRNPLLLTIMLMTYEQFAEVPSKMHVFYKLAFDTLSRSHDARKGGYHRVLKTGLSAERIYEYIALFCSCSYVDEKFEFDDDQFEMFFKQIKPKAKKGTEDITCQDFLYDLQHNLCLLYHEDNKYRFIHRSFQEYFAAVSFSNQLEKTLTKLGEWFENKRRRNLGDQTFEMLYDMIPVKVENFIFLPFLEDLITKCNQDKEYLTFVETIFPYIYYFDGDVEDQPVNEPSSFLYSFISDHAHFSTSRDLNDFPKDDYYIEHEYGYKIYEQDDCQELVNIDEATPDENGNTEVVGTTYSVDVSSIIPEMEYHKEFFKCLNDDLCDLKLEYNDMLKFYQKLKSQKEEKKIALFDEFI